MSTEVIDYTGDWEDDDDLDFLSDGELDFLEASTPDYKAEGGGLTYDDFFHSILTGVTLSHNLQKKINLLTEESANASFSRSETINGQIIEMAKKMFMADKTINQLIRGAYVVFEQDNRFWHNSSIDVYKNYYEILKDNYKKKYPDSEAIDFLKNEYTFFSNEDINGLNTTHNTIAIYDKLRIVDYVSRLNIDNKEFFNVVRQRKLDFVAGEIEKLGYRIEITKKKKVKVVKASEPLPENLDADVELEISNIPNYNIEQRFELFKQLGFEKLLTGIDTSQKSKNMIVALLMGISVDNAKKLLNGTYKKSRDPEKDKSKTIEIAGEIKDFMERNEIIIKK